MGIVLVILGSIMIIVGACLIWRASLILQRFLHQETLDVSLAGMVEELETVARSGIEAIEAERKKVEELLAAFSQQIEAQEQAVSAKEVSAKKAFAKNAKKASSKKVSSKEVPTPKVSSKEMLAKELSTSKTSLTGVPGKVSGKDSVDTDFHSAEGGSGNFSRTNYSRYEEVWRLTDEGVSSVDIAKRLGMGRGEVELIQELRNYVNPEGNASRGKS